MADAAPAAKTSAISGWMKAIFGGTVGLLGGAATMYSTAIVDKIVKPNKPMANFATKVDGLLLTCESRATGDSGWWDFGDGTALEPFQPNQSPTHTYAKSGSYNVKLTVRNFLSEENDRTVPVEVGTAAAAAASKGSADSSPIAILKVEPTSPNPVAPATFKVTAEVKNADKAFIDVVSSNIDQAGGSSPNKIEVKQAGGIIETLVLVEKPGQHVIQLFGTKGDSVVRRSAFVTVGAPADGAVICYLSVTDTGIKTNTRKITTTVPISIPAKGEAKTFEKIITGMPGYQINETKIVNVMAKLATNVKVLVAADKQSFKVVGDWNGKPEALLKAAGGTDLMLPIEVTYVQQEPVSITTKVKASLARGSEVVTLPPALVGVSNPQRTIDVELVQYRATGERAVMGTGKVANGKMNQRITWAGQSYTLDVAIVNQQATVSLGR